MTRSIEHVSCDVCGREAFRDPYTRSVVAGILNTPWCFVHVAGAPGFDVCPLCAEQGTPSELVRRAEARRAQAAA